MSSCSVAPTEALRVDYLLVGGVALLSFVRGRNTQDIDLIIAPESVSRMPWTAVIHDAILGVRCTDRCKSIFG